ncbi:hypothetical protein QOT74_00465 [Pseudomonas aeruginosa]|uniref:hypothetical protein n=1 Tax=Pseudomonas aeruginosa group TaxID=136841 RepID=UPI000F51CD8E|nr:hypothetical protein [Pseudomonas aeruginosa]MBH4270535.1 hypothetical protein [Pseudomonas aeruginosa]MBH8933673.1 hypothetical protein [Pseudomonas aeruginosa]MBI7073329.1 hypothetical protein [Pseudomonas aeruginosa]MBV5564387.1 hypothetical protein [Pseudomonas aeruginosa]MCO4012493.1 hypothetical protein [Pseudomonas aeruginosa]
MNLANLISKQCSRDPSEVLTDEQAMSLWGEREVARQAAQNMALGVAAVGNLLANVGAEGEVGQETSERLGWFLEEIGGGIFQLVELEQVLSDRINRQKEAQQ